MEEKTGDRKTAENRGQTSISMSLISAYFVFPLISLLKAVILAEVSGSPKCN